MDNSSGSTGEPVATMVTNGWNNFWFRPRSPLTLGAIRFCTGFVVLYIHLVYTFDLHALFGKDAWVNQQTMQELREHYRPGILPFGWNQLTPQEIEEITPKGWAVSSVFFHITEPGWVVFTHGVILLIMFLFMIGFCTRVTSVLTWLGAMCYIQRAPTTLFGMDNIMNVLLMYLMIGSSGAALSVDRLIAKWRARKRGEELGPPQPLVMANVPIRMMQIHFCIIYFVSGVSKLQGPSWWSGGAIWGTMANYSFSPMSSALYLDFITFLAKHRWFWELIMLGGAYYTLAVEISFAFLVWRPRWRWVMICASVLLHTGIAIIMGLATFSLMMMCLLLCYVPTETMQSFLSSVQSKFQKSGQATTAKANLEKEPSLAG